MNPLNSCVLFQELVRLLANVCYFLQALPGGVCFITITLSDAINFIYTHFYMFSCNFRNKQRVLLVKKLVVQKRKEALTTESCIVITCQHGVSLFCCRLSLTIVKVTANNK